MQTITSNNAGITQSISELITFFTFSPNTKITTHSGNRCRAEYSSAGLGDNHIINISIKLKANLLSKIVKNTSLRDFDSSIRIHLLLRMRAYIYYVFLEVS